MGDCVQSVLAVWLGIAPTAIAVDPVDVDGWMKVGGLAVLAIILTRQLVLAHKRNNELQDRNMQLSGKIRTMCDKCDLVRENREFAHAARKEIVERISGEYDSKDGRFH